MRPVAKCCSCSNGEGYIERLVDSPILSVARYRPQARDICHIQSPQWQVIKTESGVFDLVNAFTDVEALGKTKV